MFRLNGLLLLDRSFLASSFIHRNDVLLYHYGGRGVALTGKTEASTVGPKLACHIATLTNEYAMDDFEPLSEACLVELLTLSPVACLRSGGVCMYPLRFAGGGQWRSGRE